MKGLRKNQKLQEKKFSFPPEEEIKKVLKRVEEPNYRRVNIGLHPDATPAEKAKYKLCKTIARYVRENNLTEKELGKKLGVDQAKTEYILFCHIDKLNLEELVNNTEKLSMPLEVKVNSKYAWEKTATKV
jgi:predicted XRE-type DNA-binding protein